VSGEFPLSPPAENVSAFAHRSDEGRRVVALAVRAGPLLVLAGDEEGNVLRHEIAVPPGGQINALALTDGAGMLVAGTAGGRLLRWSLTGSEAPRLEEEPLAGSDGAGVTSLVPLAGGRSLAVAAGTELSVWSLVRDAGHPSGWSLRCLHRLPPPTAPIGALSATDRHRGFLAAGRDGRVSLYHATSERRLLGLEGAGESLVRIALAPRADGAAGVDESGTLWSWWIDAPHPEISWRTLFGKIWYEGYEGPEYVWQSTGSTDDFEPKLSLVPLAFGTLKGTLYALLFAVPLAVAAALYTALFASPRARGVVKPVVELMAGLPSVVIGFLAGLWLAPLVERRLAAALALLVGLPVLVLACASVWGVVPRGVRKRLPQGGELYLLLPLTLLGVALAAALGPVLEQWAFAGDIRAWIFQTLGLQYDQRNALVVGLAMGFAVIPLIFTIAEDALGGVPEHLLSGALALGASRWQAALKVILPTASPAIFSAVMIGFGRAVGETMIVLMATGNTPIMEWSAFNGLRTLSANIAVEMPEAPHAGTLYRVLFLAAALLFAITFIVNTAAELVRMRLRARYARL
jgi:phosphate transport system permease protein